MCNRCTALPQEIEEALELVWYERDKSDLPDPPVFWRAIWPEGGKPEHERVNFIAMLYFTAPTREAALREFQRWAEVRMRDIPFCVLEEVQAEDVPRCPSPWCEREHNGEQRAGIWSELT